MSWYVVLAAVHLIGLVFGLGGVTVTDVVNIYGFFKPSIMPKTVPLFKSISLVVWVGLFLLVSSGIGLTIVGKDIYGDALYSWLFYLKLTFTGIVLINGLFLNLVVTPAFEHSVHLPDFNKTKEFGKAKILGLISGGLSFISWWSAFFLGVYIFKISS